jgi:hypothetical protein
MSEPEKTLAQKIIENAQTKEPEPEQKMPNVLELSGQNVKYEDLLRDVVQKLLESGQLIIVGCKQTGKTNAAMCIMREIMNSAAHKNLAMKTEIFDTVLQWHYNYDAVQYLNLEDYRILPTVLDLIIDVPFTDSIETRNAIGQIVLNDFIKKRAMKEKFDGKVPFFDVFVVEEAQNILGSYSLQGDVGRFWLKVISEAMNFKMVFLFIGQRLADISSRVIERSRFFLLGATSGDNDLNKIKRMGGKNLANAVVGLHKGEFVFFDREEKSFWVIGFPKFVQNGKPYPYTNGIKGNKGYAIKLF